MIELETRRLKLRPVNYDDVQSIFNNWASDPEVAKYVTWKAHDDISVTKSVMNYWIEEYKKENFYRYGIERKEDKELIGMIDVVGYHHGNPVLGYCIGRKYWNKGYATEALKAVMDKLIADGYNELVIEAVDENIGSNRVILKNGFKLVDTRETNLSDIKPQIVKINSYRYYANKIKI